MARFLRSKSLRAALWIAADGKCQQCGCELPGDWHADHTTPWVVTGRTNVHEMRALCPSCNLTKGAKMADRAHQAKLRERLKDAGESDFPLRILAWVVPGGGKSRLPGILAERFPRHKIGWFVPRLSLRKQAAKGMAQDFGLRVWEAENEPNPTHGERGFVATHASLMENPALWRDEFARHPYVLIVDEHHHAKFERDGTRRPLSSALCGLKADVSLFMTGTLETSDNTLIHGTIYDSTDAGLLANPERSARIYIRYDRVTALRERAIVPIEFMHHDGPVKWKYPATEEKERRLSEVTRADEGAALVTALRTEVAIQLFESGLDHWRRTSAGGKLLVVTDNQRTARDYHKRLTSAGLTSALAIDDNPTAHEQVEEFRKQGGQYVSLVTCQMAYEGLDVPSASHLICLTHIRSAPWIEQMLARVWRFAPRKARCWAFVPDDPRMNRVIAAIKAEQLSVIPEIDDRPGPGPAEGEREPVLALGGSVDSITQKYLDDHYASGAVDRLMECVRGLGLTGDEDEVRALLRRAAEPRLPPPGVSTVTEQAARLRSQIADECRSIDSQWARARGTDKPSFGETQGKLIRVTGKPIGEMTIQELKNAHTKLQSLRP